MIQGDLSAEAPEVKYQEKNITWIPEYTDTFLNNLWLPLIDNTPETQKPIPIQNCTFIPSDHISSANHFRLNPMYFLVFSFTVSVLT